MRGAAERVPDQRHAVLPRPRSLRGPARQGDPPAGPGASGRRPARLGAGVFQRRGSLFHRHAAGFRDARRRSQAALHRLCLGYRPPHDRSGARRHLSDQRAGRYPRGPAPRLHKPPRRADADRAAIARPGAVFAAFAGARSALQPGGPDLVPQPADLSGRGTAIAHPAAVSLRAASGRLSAAGSVRRRAARGDPLHRTRPSGAALPPGRGARAAAAGPALFRRPQPAPARGARQHARQRRPVRDRAKRAAPHP